MLRSIHLLMLLLMLIMDYGMLMLLPVITSCKESCLQHPDIG